MRRTFVVLLVVLGALRPCVHGGRLVSECERRHPGCTLWPAYKLSKAEFESRNGSTLARWKEEWDASESGQHPYHVLAASQGLLELKALVVEDPWGYTKDWVPDKHPCDFSQVLCNWHGVVIGVDLAGLAAGAAISHERSSGGSGVAREAKMPSLVLRELPQGPRWTLLGRMSLRIVRLDNARLQNARLPAAWQEFSQLTEVSLSGCGLVGGLPPEWGRLAKLERLFLGGNELTGPLPAAWAGMESLQVLDAGLPAAGRRERLTGSLPGDWQFLYCLRVLDLWNQGITGTLPAAWAELPALEVVSLSGTEVSGRLPQAWGRMRNLTTVGLAGTRISGPLPPAWGSATNLSWVDLRGTQVTAPAPWSWQSFCRGKKQSRAFPSAAYLPWNGGEVLASTQRPEPSLCSPLRQKLQWQLPVAAAACLVLALLAACTCRRMRAAAKFTSLKRS